MVGYIFKTRKRIRNKKQVDPYSKSYHNWYEVGLSCRRSIWWRIKLSKFPEHVYFLQDTTGRSSAAWKPQIATVIFVKTTASVFLPRLCKGHPGSVQCLRVRFIVCVSLDSQGPIAEPEWAHAWRTRVTPTPGASKTRPVVRATTAIAKTPGG